MPSGADLVHLPRRRPGWNGPWRTNALSSRGASPWRGAAFEALALGDHDTHQAPRRCLRASEPSFTASAPAAIAFGQMCPELRMPPGVMRTREDILHEERLRRVVDGPPWARPHRFPHGSCKSTRARRRASPHPRPHPPRAALHHPVATFPPTTSIPCCSLDVTDDVEHPIRVAVGGVHREDVHLRAYSESRRPIERVVADPRSRADPKPALIVLRRVRVLDALRDVALTVISPLAAIRVDHRELLDLVAVEDRLGLLERRPTGAVRGSGSS